MRLTFRAALTILVYCTDSFRIIAKYHFAEGTSWYKRFGVHHAWGDQDESLSAYGQTPNTLIACVDGDVAPPRVLLFSPKHIDYPKELVPPRFIKNDIWQGIECDDCDEESQNRMPVEGEALNGGALPSSPIAMPEEVPIKVDDSPSHKNTAELPETENMSDAYIPRLRPYIIPTEGLAYAKQSAIQAYGKPIDGLPVNLECVAISPRGARWIVAVGSAGAIVAFELQPGEEGEEWTFESEGDDRSLVSLSDTDKEA
jgi:hypothetical protein